MTRSALLALLLVPLAAHPARATPRDTLLRLIPDDVGFCLVLSGLREHHDPLLRSPWLKAAGNAPLGKALRDAPDLAKLAGLDEPLRKSLGVTWARLRDDVLGDAVVLAFRPGEREDLDRGALLLHARDPKLLALLITRLNEEGARTGAMKELQERRHKGLKYHCRAGGKDETFYYLDGPILVWTADEGLLQQILDRRGDAKGALPWLPVAEQARQAGAEKALATIWVNPRSLDAELREQAASLAGAEAQAFAAFLGYWKALDGVSVSLVLDESPEVVLGLHARTDALPPALRRLAAQTAQPTQLWGHFPADSVLTMASRADLAALSDAIHEFLPPGQRRPLQDGVRESLGVPLGDGFLKQVLPQLGPDWGVCVLPSTDGKAPPQALFALRLRPGAGKGSERGWVGLAQLVVSLAVLDHNLKNKDTVQMRKEMQDGVEVHYFAGGNSLPPGVRPSIATKGGYLLLATSPEAVRRFAARAVPMTAEAAPLLRASLPRVARLLRERAEAPGLLGAGKGLPPEQARELLGGLVGAAELFDRVEVSQRGAGERITWAVRLGAAARPD